MNFVNLSHVPFGLIPEGLEILHDLRNLPVPEVVENVKTATDLANVAAEDIPKFLPTILRNDFELAANIAETGRAVHECAFEISRINGKIGIAFGIGSVAIGGIVYCLNRMNKQEKRIQKLERKANQS